MTTPEPQSDPKPTTPREGNPYTRLATVINQAARFPGDAQALGSGERAALARLEPERPRPHQIAALSRALIQAGLEPEAWSPDTWRRWALIAHGIALAGHDGTQPLGVQLHRAGVAESRITKLLTARDDAFRQLLPPLLRLLASQGVPPNWGQLGALIISQGRDEERAEALRMQIAARYFSAQAKAASH